MAECKTNGVFVSRIYETSVHLCLMTILYRTRTLPVSSITEVVTSRHDAQNRQTRDWAIYTPLSSTPVFTAFKHEPES